MTGMQIDVHINEDTKRLSGLVKDFPNTSALLAFTRVMMEMDESRIDFYVREGKREEFGLLLMNLGEWLYHSKEGTVDPMATPEAEQ